MLATMSTVWGRTLACTLLIQTKSLLGKTKKQSAFGSTQKRRETFKTIFLTLLMWGTLKQEVDRHKEEAALFDNTKWCKDTAKYDTCRTHILILIMPIRDDIFSKKQETTFQTFTIQPIIWQHIRHRLTDAIYQHIQVLLLRTKMCQRDVN